MPRRGVSGAGGPKGFFESWKAELPRVAASLTLALVLFLVSLIFAPVRKWLFSAEAAPYPLVCTADPVAAPDGRRIVEFYVLNRSREDLTGEQLQQSLDEALRGSGSSASAAIVLNLTGGEGRIEAAVPNEAFNRGKGELTVSVEGETVRIRIGQINGGSLLRVDIVLVGMADIGPISRDAKVAVPFDYQDIQEACYTRR